MTDRLAATALRHVPTRDDVADLAAINTTILNNGTLVFVTGLQDYFYLLKESTAAPVANTIVQSATGSPGRWYRLGVGGGSSWATQAAWFIDEQDVSGNANDSNEGDSAAAPLATTAEFNRRLGSPANVYGQDTTVTLLSSCNPTSVLSPGGRVSPGFSFRVTGVATTTATLTSAAAQNIVVGSDRPFVQLGASWDPALIGSRCRVTASTGATQVGTVFWLEEIDGVDDTIAYINQPYFAVPGAFGGPQSLEAGGGDTFVVESLPSAGLIDLELDWNQLDSFYPQVIVDNVSGVDAAQSVGSLGASSRGSVACYGCDLNYNLNFVGGNTLEACKIGGSQADNEFHSVGPGCFPVACSFQRTGGSAGFFRLYGGIDLFTNCSFAHTRAVLGSNSVFAAVPTYVHCSGAVSTWDWAGAAWQCEPATQILFEAAAWGTSARASSRGVQIFAGAFGQYPAGTPPTVSGTSTELTVGGVTGTYAALLPIINPANNAAMVIHA